MNLEAIQDVVLSAVKDYLISQDVDVLLTTETLLFGEGAVLDSMGLVNIVIDIESALLDNGLEVSLTSDVAMSRRQSPFRSVKSLAEFILEQSS